MYNPWIEAAKKLTNKRAAVFYRKTARNHSQKTVQVISCLAFWAVEAGAWTREKVEPIISQWIGGVEADVEADVDADKAQVEQKYLPPAKEEVDSTSFISHPIGWEMIDPFGDWDWIKSMTSDLDEMSLQQLRSVAMALKINGWTRMSKDRLKEAIKDTTIKVNVN